MEDSPIEYPTIEIPGKGTFSIKFGWGALYTLEKEHHVNESELRAQLSQWFPKKTPGGAEQPGRVSPSLVLDILSACIWDQAKLTPREIADAFGDPGELKVIAPKILLAFVKAPWLAKKRLQAPTTEQGQAAA